jgi:hypothetical protein
MIFWNELVAAWGDIFSLGLTVLVLIVAAAITAVLWYTWPSWWRALARLRVRDRKGRKRKEREAREVTDEELDALVENEEELPAIDPVVYTTLADRFAADGRYAEAVRERLRAMVRQLITEGVLTHHPGWTVTELAREAGAVRAGVGGPVTAASGIFSDIWYAKRPALIEHDAQMRGYATELSAALTGGAR